MKSRRHSTEKTGRSPKSATSTTISHVKSLPKAIWTHVSGLGRNTKLALSLAAVLIVVIGLITIIGRGSDDQLDLSSSTVQELTEENKSTALFAASEGTVEIKNQEGDWAKAANDDVLSEGDDVRTVGATSRASIRFENGSELRIDANSEVALETLTTERVVIKQLSGYTYSRINPAQPVSYIVATTDAQYEASGTAFHVIASGDEQAVEVFESSVIETSTNQEVGEGKKLIVKSSVAPVDDGKIESIDIEEAKENRFIAWNREQDSKNELFKDKLGFLSDIVPPEVTITSPATNETILLEPNATKATVVFKGNTEASARLKIVSKSSSSGAKAIDVVIKADGSFTSPVIEGAIGSSVFEFTVTDRTGNKTVLNTRVTFQRKSAPVVAGGIVLSVKKNGDSVMSTWSYSGSFTPEHGVKLVYSTSASPTYVVDQAVYSEFGNNVSVELSDLDPATKYYFRACAYDKSNDTCSSYSNQASYTTP